MNDSANTREDNRKNSLFGVSSLLVLLFLSIPMGAYPDGFYCSSVLSSGVMMGRLLHLEAICGQPAELPPSPLALDKLEKDHAD